MKFLIAKTQKKSETSDAFAETFGDTTVTYQETEIYWTDETSSNRYGFGTICFEDWDYGVKDLVPGDKLKRTVAQWLCDSYLWGSKYGRDGYYNPEEMEILKRFCSQWPDGPQFEPENGLLFSQR